LGTARVWAIRLATLLKDIYLLMAIHALLTKPAVMFLAAL
jgi:hypothetical protein